MADYPKTRREMERAGYRRTGEGVCKDCGAAIEWWKTAKGKSVPFNPIANDHDLVARHWETCPNAKDFKGNAAPAPTPAPARRPDKEAELRSLRARHDARVVVMVDEDGTVAFWKLGIPAEDLRHDLISAANFVRSEISKGDPTL